MLFLIIWVAVSFLLAIAFGMFARGIDSSSESNIPSDDRDPEK